MTHGDGPISATAQTDAAGIPLHYACDLDALPDGLAGCFVRLDCDAAALLFLDRVLSARHGRFLTGVYRGLRKVLSDYDAYGVLGMYAMHLLSTPQLQVLLGDRPTSMTHPRSVLDVGAGNGDITAFAAALFDAVTVTEASAVMRRHLAKRGFRVLDLDLATQPLPDGEVFDAVLCCNVLDRCTHPRTLLRHLRAGLAPGAALLISVPLPLSPHVQRRGHTSDPDEPLPAPSETWEAGAASLAREVFTPTGLRVQRLSRVPYLCRGDAAKPLYVLDAAVFVCVAA